MSSLSIVFIYVDAILYYFVLLSGSLCLFNFSFDYYNNINDRLRKADYVQ